MSSADAEEIKSYMDERAARIHATLDDLLLRIVGLSNSLDSRFAALERSMEAEFQKTRDLLAVLAFPKLPRIQA